MSITNPFAKSFNNNSNNFNSNNNTDFNSSSQNSSISKNIPPKAHTSNLSKTDLPPKRQNQLTGPPPSFSNFSPQTQSQQNNFFNNNNTINEDDYTKIKLDFDTNIKQYNCSPEYISTTSLIFPKDVQTLSQLSIPMSVSLCPMKNTENEIPFVNYGDNNIPRCDSKSCRAYMNPFIKFIEGGEKWLCNFCGQINNTEDFYYSDVDKNGIRLDKNEKPELCCGSYEFYANKSYWKKGKGPTEAFFIFIFETSMSAIDNGFFMACIESVKDVINNESFFNGKNVKISIMTYNSAVDFYSYNKKYTQPQMLTVNEEAMFLPTDKNNLIFNLNEDKDKILQTLDLIQNTFNKNNQNIPNNNCKDSLQIFNAISGAFLIGNHSGGKIVIFSSSNNFNSIPKMVIGLNKNMTKEQIAYSPHDQKVLGQIGIKLTNANMSIDIFACADVQIHTFTLNQLCEYTNGHFYFYKKFRIESHYKNIFNQIRRALTRPTFWESVNRTRFSSGYKISSYLTPILVANGDLFVFPVGDSDQNFMFNISPTPPKQEDEKESKEKKNNYFYTYDIGEKDKYLYIQSALLYSCGDGTRRIRVHNLCLPLTTNINYIYKEINSEMIATYYLKDTIDKLYKTKNIANSIISTDTQFKQFIDKVMSSQNKLNKELISNLDYLPLYMIGMFKHRIFCKDEIEKNYDLDISNYLRISLQKLSTQEIISFIVPSIYSLHDLESDKNIGTYNSENGDFILPNLISCSKSSMEDNGLYLIDNGYMLIIYVKKNVSINIFQNLFGVENLSFLTMITNEDNVFDENNNNEFKERIKNILDYIRGGKTLYQNLVFVFEGEGSERIINESLIEDNFCKWFPMDYSTFYKKYIKGNNTFGY